MEVVYKIFEVLVYNQTFCETLNFLIDFRLINSTFLINLIKKSQPEMNMMGKEIMKTNNNIH